MKRIDDKIKEIEKKDKTNRWAYYIIVALLIAFLIYASTTRKSLNEKDETIAEQLEKIEAQLKVEKALTKQLDDSINELNRSLKPDEYWQHIEDENTTEGYIAFLTNDWGIDKSAYVNPAIEKLKSDAPVGFEGWLFVGTKNNAGIYDSRNLVEIVYRQYYEGDKATLKNLEPKVGDIVRLKTTVNRITYRNKNMTGKNSQGFRNKTKAFVSEIYKDPNSTNFNIKIKYY